MRLHFLPLTAVAAVALFLVAGCSSPVTTTATTTPPAAEHTTAAPLATSAPALSHPTTTSKAPVSAVVTDHSTGPYAAPSGHISLSGSGSSFVQPLVDAWSLQFANDHSNIQVSYGGGGSGKGITDITQKQVAFAGTDAPLQQSDKDKAPGILMFPETIGPVAVIYSVEGVPDGLHFTCDLLGQIYTGAVSMWNDPAIKALNPGVTLPEMGITTVHRSDSSGTTFVFTDYMGHCSPTWTAKMGSTPSKSPGWANSGAPLQLAGDHNDGVASTVATNPGTIGYVDLDYAVKLNLNSALIQNKAGQWVAPSADGASKAAAAFASSLPAADGDWSKISIVDSAADGAYPISSFTYILVYNSVASYGGKLSADDMTALKAWLWWDIHGGQALGPGLHYAPLPEPVVKIGENALAMIH